MHVIDILEHADVCENISFLGLALKPAAIQNLLKTSRKVRRSVLVRKLLFTLCGQIPLPIYRNLARASWAGTRLLSLGVSVGEVHRILTTITVLMPVAHAYSDGSEQSKRMRALSFQSIQRAQVVPLVVNVLEKNLRTPAIADRLLCCLQNCMVNLDGTGSFATCIDLSDFTTRDALVYGLLRAYDTAMTGHISQEVLVGCILYELCTPAAAPDVIARLFARFFHCAEQRYSIHTAYHQMVLLKLLRAHGADLAVQFYLEQSAVCERLLVLANVNFGHVMFGEDLMLPVLMLIARILELRFHMPWGDEPVYSDIISVLHRLRGHGSPMLREASMPILRSLISTYQVRFCFLFSVSQRVIAYSLFHCCRKSNTYKLLTLISKSRHVNFSNLIMQKYELSRQTHKMSIVLRLKLYKIKLILLYTARIAYEKTYDMRALFNLISIASLLYWHDLVVRKYAFG